MLKNNNKIKKKHSRKQVTTRKNKENQETDTVTEVEKMNSSQTLNYYI